MNIVRVSRLLALATLLVVARRTEAQQIAYAADLGAEMDSVSRASITREITLARDRGLPVEALVAKVREGRLKRANGLRIHVAVVALARRLDSARAGLGPNSTPEELAAGADAIAAGGDVSSLRTLRAATTRSVAAPVGTFAQLLASGVERARALTMVVNLLHRNATPAQLLALGNLVESDVVAGIRPDEAAAFRLRAIEGMSILSGDKVEVAAPAPVTQPPATQSQPPKRRP